MLASVAREGLQDLTGPLAGPPLRLPSPYLVALLLTCAGLSAVSILVPPVLGCLTALLQHLVSCWEKHATSAGEYRIGPLPSFRFLVWLLVWALQ